MNSGRRNSTLNLKQMLNVFRSSEPNPLEYIIFSSTLYCPSIAILAIGIPILYIKRIFYSVNVSLKNSRFMMIFIQLTDHRGNNTK